MKRQPEQDHKLKYCLSFPSRNRVLARDGVWGFLLLVVVTYLLQHMLMLAQFLSTSRESPCAIARGEGGS